MLKRLFTLLLLTIITISMILFAVSAAAEMPDKIAGYTQLAQRASARESLISDWIWFIRVDDGTARKAGSVKAPGQCKRYLINSFAAVAEKYTVNASPESRLNMPEEHNVDARIKGAAWTMPPVNEGNPFFTLAEYDFNRYKTTKENKAEALAFLSKALPGDVVQMMAVYSNGERGTHTFLITAPYDEAADEMHWADSNFRAKVVDETRYGIVEADQVWKGANVASWLANPSCAATIYRLRYDIIYKNNISYETLELASE